MIISAVVCNCVDLLACVVCIRHRKIDTLTKPSVTMWKGSGVGRSGWTGSQARPALSRLHDLTQHRTLPPNIHCRLSFKSEVLLIASEAQNCTFDSDGIFAHPTNFYFLTKRSLPFHRSFISSILLFVSSENPLSFFAFGIQTWKPTQVHKRSKN